MSIKRTLNSDWFDRNLHNSDSQEPPPNIEDDSCTFAPNRKKLCPQQVATIEERVTSVSSSVLSSSTSPQNSSGDGTLEFNVIYQLFNGDRSKITGLLRGLINSLNEPLRNTDFCRLAERYLETQPFLTNLEFSDILDRHYMSQDYLSSRPKPTAKVPPSSGTLSNHPAMIGLDDWNTLLPKGTNVCFRGMPDTPLKIQHLCFDRHGFILAQTEENSDIQMVDLIPLFKKGALYFVKSASGEPAVFEYLEDAPIQNLQNQEALFGKHQMTRSPEDNTITLTKTNEKISFKFGKLFKTMRLPDFIPIDPKSLESISPILDKIALDWKSTSSLKPKAQPQNPKQAKINAAIPSSPKVQSSTLLFSQNQHATTFLDISNSGDKIIEQLNSPENDHSSEQLTPDKNGSPQIIELDAFLGSFYEDVLNESNCFDSASTPSGTSMNASPPLSSLRAKNPYFPLSFDDSSFSVSSLNRLPEHTPISSSSTSSSSSSSTLSSPLKPHQDQQNNLLMSNLFNQINARKAKEAFEKLFPIGTIFCLGKSLKKKYNLTKFKLNILEKTLTFIGKALDVSHEVTLKMDDCLPDFKENDIYFFYDKNKCKYVLVKCCSIAEISGQDNLLYYFKNYNRTSPDASDQTQPFLKMDGNADDLKPFCFPNFIPVTTENLDLVENLIQKWSKSLSPESE